MEKLTAEQARAITKQANEKAFAEIHTSIKAMAEHGNRYAMIRTVFFDDDLRNQIMNEFQNLGYTTKYHEESENKCIEFNW